MESNESKVLWELSEAEVAAKLPGGRVSYPLIKDLPLLSEEEKISLITHHFEKIMNVLGLDLEDDSLKKTPHRVAKMYVKEIFKGLSTAHFPEITCIENKFHPEGSDMIFTGDIHLCSFCEHHFVPMIGKAYLAYYPRKKLIGLSKINRVMKYFSSRPQVQERLTAQIFEAFKEILSTEDIALAIKFKHFCVAVRGVRDCSSNTSTFSFGGKFEKDPFLRREFLRQTSLEG